MHITACLFIFILYMYVCLYCLPIVCLRDCQLYWVGLTDKQQSTVKTVERIYT